MEKFTDISGFKGRYKINQRGDVWSIQRNRLMKPRTDQKGYSKVALTDSNGNFKISFVHRLLALTFIPNIDNSLQVNHINGIKSDNRVENLEWCTCQKNIQEAHRLGLDANFNGEKSCNSKLSDHLAQCVKDIGVRERGDVAYLARIFEVSRYTISRIISGKTYKHLL